MNSKTFNTLVQLNKHFYKSVAKSFSDTRQKPWNGWGRVVEHIQKRYGHGKSLSVLDLGCGNGRFLSYIQNKLGGWTIDYTGVDTNIDLLKIAKTKANKEFKEVNAHFFNEDIILNIFQTVKHYDVIVAFGLTHHIPSEMHRKIWFKDVSKLLATNALLFLTFWNYHHDKRYAKAVKFINNQSTNIRESDLDDGDYFLKWAQEKNTYRYVHAYSQNEMSQIITQTGLRLIDSYVSDGRTNKLNTYLVLSNSND